MKIITITKTQNLITKKDKKDFDIWLASKGMKACDFAKRVGISSAYLTLLFNRKRKITNKMVSRFKKAGFKFEEE